MENFRAEKKYRITYVDETKKCIAGPQNKESSFAKELEKVIDVILLHYFDKDDLNYHD